MMKSFSHQSLILALCGMLMLSGVLYGQAPVPRGINYQAIARTASGAVYVNQPIAVKVSILQGGPEGLVQYSERHEVTTNVFGLFSFKIGGGTPLSGTFGDITWNTANHYVKTEVDPLGGTNYTTIGASELLSVPYALYAENGGGGGGQQGPPGPQGEQGPVGPQGEPGPPGAGYEAGSGIAINGLEISNTGDTDPADDITIGSTAGGDLAGTYPDPTVKGIQGTEVSDIPPTDGQVLRYNGGSGKYEPVSIAATGIGVAGEAEYSTSALTLTTSFQLIPGLQKTVYVPEGASVYVTALCGMYSNFSGVAGSAVEFQLLADGALPQTYLGSGYAMFTLYHTSNITQIYDKMSISHLYTNLSAGNHTFELQSKKQVLGGNATITVGGDNVAFNQGMLTVLVFSP